MEDPSGGGGGDQQAGSGSQEEGRVSVSQAQQQRQAQGDNMNATDSRLFTSRKRVAEESEEEGDDSVTPEAKRTSDVVPVSESVVESGVASFPSSSMILGSSVGLFTSGLQVLPTYQVEMEIEVGHQGAQQVEAAQQFQGGSTAGQVADSQPLTEASTMLNPSAQHTPTVEQETRMTEGGQNAAAMTAVTTTAAAADAMVVGGEPFVSLLDGESYVHPCVSGASCCGGVLVHDLCPIQSCSTHHDRKKKPDGFSENILANHLSKKHPHMLSKLEGFRKSALPNTQVCTRCKWWVMKTKMADHLEKNCQVRIEEGEEEEGIGGASVVSVSGSDVSGRLEESAASSATTLEVSGGVSVLSTSAVAVVSGSVREETASGETLVVSGGVSVVSPTAAQQVSGAVSSGVSTSAAQRKTSDRVAAGPVGSGPGVSPQASSQVRGGVRPAGGGANTATQSGRVSNGPAAGVGSPPVSVGPPIPEVSGADRFFESVSWEQIEKLVIATHPDLWVKEVAADMGRCVENMAMGIVKAVEEGKKKLEEVLLKKLHLFAGYILHVKARGGEKRSDDDSVKTRLQLFKQGAYSELHKRLLDDMQDRLWGGEIEEWGDVEKVKSAEKDVRRGRVGRGFRTLTQERKVIAITPELHTLLLSKLNDEEAEKKDAALRKSEEKSAEKKYQSVVLIEGVLAEVIKRAPKGVSAARSGWRYEFLARMIKLWPALTAALTKLGNVFMKGGLSPSFVSRYAGGVLIGVPKDGDVTNPRPVVMVECLYKLFGATAARQLQAQVNAALMPLQASMEKGATGVLPLALEHALKQDRELVLAMLDCSNAYGCVSRTAVRRGLIETGLDCLVSVFDATYGPRQNSVVSKVDNKMVSARSKVGLFAGDPLCPLYFSVAQLGAQKAATRVMEEQAKRGKMVLKETMCAYLDDNGGLGRPELLNDPLRVFMAEVSKIGLRINHDKSVVVSYSAEQLEKAKRLEVFKGVKLKVVDLTKDVHKILGIPVGAPDKVKQLMDELAESEKVAIEKIRKLDSKQCAYFMVKHVAVARSMHYLRALEGEVIAEYTKVVDRAVDVVVLFLFGVPALDEATKAQVALPEKKGGLGLTRAEEVRDCAFLGARAQVLNSVDQFLPLHAKSVEKEIAESESVTTALRRMKAVDQQSIEVAKKSPVNAVKRVAQKRVPKDREELKALGDKAQKQLSEVLHTRNENKYVLKVADDPAMLTNLVSLQQPGANAAINLAAFSTYTPFSNPQFEHMLAWRSRRQAPSHKVKYAQCSCLCNKHTFGNDSTADAYHSSTCKFLGTSSKPHDRVRDAFAQFCKEELGYGVTIEPRVEHGGYRGDVIVHGNVDEEDRLEIIDVSIAAAKGAEKREQEKEDKYDAVLKASRMGPCKIVPLVIENTGKVGKKGRKLISKLVERSGLPVHGGELAARVKFNFIARLVTAMHKGRADAARDLIDQVHRVRNPHPQPRDEPFTFLLSSEQVAKDMAIYRDARHHQSYDYRRKHNNHTVTDQRAHSKGAAAGRGGLGDRR